MHLSGKNKIWIIWFLCYHRLMMISALKLDVTIDRPYHKSLAIWIIEFQLYHRTSIVSTQKFGITIDRRYLKSQTTWKSISIVSSNVDGQCIKILICERADVLTSKIDCKVVDDRYHIEIRQLIIGYRLSVSHRQSIYLIGVSQIDGFGTGSVFPWITHIIFSAIFRYILSLSIA